MEKRGYNHIILISLDSLRLDAISSLCKTKFIKKYSSSKSYNTSILDDIIKNGTVFLNCISAAPYTSASHAAYFTGCWPRNNGIYEFYNRKIQRKTIFEIAKGQGFTTIFQTDFPIILGKTLGLTNGVDNYFIEEEHKALNYLIKNKNKKTLSFIHFAGIHYPYGFHKLKFGGENYLNKVKLLEKEFGLNALCEPKDILDEAIRDKRDKDLLFRYKQIIEFLYSSSNYTRLYNLYLEGIEFFLKNRLNKFIKELIDFVDKENALLVIFSDHGENWDKDSKGHSNTISDAALRVPLIFYGNNIPKNKKIKELVRTIDLFPTVCKLANLKHEPVDGSSINLFNKNEETKRYAIAQVWRVGDKTKVYNHQKQMMEGNKYVKPLKTTLEKEALYLDKYILNRFHVKDSSSDKFYINNPPKTRLIHKKPTKINQINRLLLDYNKINKKNGKISSIRKEIAEGLNLLGYRV